MPTASDGAPPVRESSEASPTCSVRRANSAPSSVKPQPRIASAAVSIVGPSAAAGALMAK